MYGLSYLSVNLGIPRARISIAPSATFHREKYRRVRESKCPAPYATKPCCRSLPRNPKSVVCRLSLNRNHHPPRRIWLAGAAPAGSEPPLWLAALRAALPQPAFCRLGLGAPTATSESSSPASGIGQFRRRSGQLASASPPVVIFRRWIGP